MGEESDEAEQELPDTLPVTNKATAGGLTMGRLQAAARALQAAEVKRIASQKERAEAFRQKAARGDYGEDIRSGKVLVVNESKDDKDDIITINPGIGSRIFPYQVEGVRFMWDQIVDPKEERGCLLAHTMGLGKTMQVITVLVTIAEAAKSDNPRIIAQIPEKLQLSRTLVMCPSSVVDNWMDELQQWAPGGVLGAVHKIDSGRISGDPATVVEQRKQLIDRWATEGGVLVIGHGLLRAMEGDEAYKSAIEQIVQSASIVVGDEAHEMKTRRTKLFELARRFKTRVRIAMTGSPLANNVDEYFSMIDWIHPGYLSDADDFTRVFRHPIEHGLYADSLPSDRRTAFKILRLLHTMMEPKVHRKTLQAVKDQLPQKREFVIYVPLKETQRKAYDMIIDGFRSEEKRKAGIFAQINPLALLLNHPSLLLQFLAKSNKGREGPIISTELVEELIPILDCKDRENPNLSPKVGMALAILEESKRKGDKVLLFSHSIETLNFLENLLRLRKYNVSRLDGSTPTTSRQDRVKEFNSDRKDVFLISTTAGGVGLNIAGANRVIIMDFRFNPVHEQQAIGRAFRIRQQKDVFVYHFVCEKTFEETLQNKSVFKRQLASRVIDAKNPISYTNRLGDLLLKSEDFKNRKRRGIEKHRGLDSVLDRVLQDFDVRQVIGTETFEEEDADARLTATEEQQVVSFWESDQADARTFMSQETGAVPKAPTSGEPAVPPEFPQTFPTATNGIQNGHGQAATAPGETPAATGRPATVQALQRRQSTTPIPVPVIPPPSAQPQQLKRASSSVLNGHGSGAVEQPSPKVRQNPRIDRRAAA